jgi:predicted metal-dependent peptidase
MAVAQVHAKQETCNSEVLGKMNAAQIAVEHQTYLYAELSQLDDLSLRKIGDQVAKCIGCSKDGGTTCPSGVAREVDTVLSERGLAWEVFGLWYYLAQSDKDYQ